MDAPAERPDPLAVRTTAAALLAVGVLGATLRLSALAGQTPFHDEWHALHAVSRLDFGQLATRFGTADHSIPVALWLEAASRLGALGDLALWLPGALGGLAAALLLARAAARRWGAPTGLLLAAALLVSPALVYFARSARPYGWSAPLALLALLAFDDWLLRGSPRAGGTALAAGFAAGWAMPVYLPFLAAPVVLRLAAPGARDPGEARVRRRRALAGGLALAAALTAALAPPALLDAGSLAAKAAGESVRADALGRAAAIAAGGWGAGWSPVAGLALLAGAGAAALRHAGGGALVPLLAGAAAQLAALAAVRPAGIASPVVLGRYALPAGLVLLLLACRGVAAILERLPERRRAALAALAAGAVAVAVWAPRAALVAGRPDNFRSTRLFHLLFFPAAELRRDFALPPAYAPIRDAPGRFAVVELPYNGYLRTPYGYYQREHGREVYVGTERGWCTDQDTRELPADGRDGFRLSRVVDPSSPAELERRGVRFVVFHRDPEAEVPWVAPERRRRDRFEFDRCVAELQRRTGVAPARDVGLAVFDLGARP